MAGEVKTEVEKLVRRGIPRTSVQRAVRLCRVVPGSNAKGVVLNLSTWGALWTPPEEREGQGEARRKGLDPTGGLDVRSGTGGLLKAADDDVVARPEPRDLSAKERERLVKRTVWRLENCRPEELAPWELQVMNLVVEAQQTRSLAMIDENIRRGSDGLYEDVNQTYQRGEDRSIAWIAAPAPEPPAKSAAQPWVAEATDQRFQRRAEKPGPTAAEWERAQRSYRR